MDVGGTELKILQVPQPYVVQLSRLFAITSISRACVYLEGVPLITYISFLLLFCSFFRICALNLSAVMYG